VDWNKEMGIDVLSVLAESPDNPEQRRRRRKWERHAEIYWAMRLVGESGKQPGSLPKDPVKRQKRVRDYQFEDWQLQVALESLRRSTHG
jgi:hypothetical protein